MNNLQKAYSTASKKVETLKALANAKEKEYILNNGIKNPDGTIPDHLWMLDDENLFDQHNEPFCSIPEVKTTHTQLRTAQESLRIAENNLLEAALNIIPNKETRQTLTNGCKTLLHIREEALKLAMRLDFSTVPTR